MGIERPQILIIIGYGDNFIRKFINCLTRNIRTDLLLRNLLLVDLYDFTKRVVCENLPRSGYSKLNNDTKLNNLLETEQNPNLTLRQVAKTNNYVGSPLGKPYPKEKRIKKHSVFRPSNFLFKRNNQSSQLLLLGTRKSTLCSSTYATNFCK